VTADRALVQSIRQRLENHARKNGIDIQRTLVRYALERLLYRLSVSEHRDRFILKGAMLFSVWEQAPFRATGDLDLLGYGPNTQEALIAAFREICLTPPAAPDGLIFETANIQAEPLRLATDYTGIAVRFDAMLGRARLRMQIDVGFGDAITPGPIEVDFPTLLDMPAPHLKAYPPETVLAEKLEAVVSLGLANTRIKDFFDIWAIAQTFNLDGAIVIAAIRATFNRRGTTFPASMPTAISAAFSNDPEKQRLWNAFVVDRIDAHRAPTDLPAVIAAMTPFVEPLLDAMRRGSSPGRWNRESQSWGRIPAQ